MSSPSMAIGICAGTQVFDRITREVSATSSTSASQQAQALPHLVQGTNKAEGRCGCGRQKPQRTEANNEAAER